jgi:hypothetical protein
MSLENAFSSQSYINNGRGRGRAYSRGIERIYVICGLNNNPINNGGSGQSQNTSHSSGQISDKSN